MQRCAIAGCGAKICILGILSTRLMMILDTDRLSLRRWRDADRAAFARMNADARVMEFMPALLTREQSDENVDRIEKHFERHHLGLCAAELRPDGVFIGFIGIWVPEFQAAFTPCVEIGWRLAAEYWGRGLATEGARAITAYAFEILKLPELVSFTVPGNVRSRRVMEKLEMTRDPAEDFDHPQVAEGHLMRRHVLYRMRNNFLGAAR